MNSIILQLGLVVGLLYILKTAWDSGASAPVRAVGGAARRVTDAAVGYWDEYERWFVMEPPEAPVDPIAGGIEDHNSFVRDLYERKSQDMANWGEGMLAFYERESLRPLLSNLDLLSIQGKQMALKLWTVDHGRPWEESDATNETPVMIPEDNLFDW